MITRRRAPLDERNVPTSVICSGSAWTPSAMPSRCTGRVCAAVTRSPNAGRAGLKQVNVPAVATASTIGVASLHALSGMSGRWQEQAESLGSLYPEYSGVAEGDHCVGLAMMLTVMIGNASCPRRCSPTKGNSTSGVGGWLEVHWQARDAAVGCSLGRVTYPA